MNVLIPYLAPMMMRKSVYELHDAHSHSKGCIRDFEDEEILDDEVDVQEERAE